MHRNLVLLIIVITAGVVFADPPSDPDISLMETHMLNLRMLKAHVSALDHAKSKSTVGVSEAKARLDKEKSACAAHLAAYKAKRTDARESWKCE